MKIIVPFVSSDVSLVSSTVPAADPLASTLSWNIASSSVANPTTITTTVPHGFTMGQNIIVTIAGHTGTTPAISGEYQAIVTGASTFTIPVNVTVGGGATGTVTSPSYNAATTYGVGAVVQMDSPTFTFTVSNYLFTAVNHGFPNGTMLQVASSGTLPIGLLANTRYYMQSITLDTFRLTLTPDVNATPVTVSTAGSGTFTATVSKHSLYESVVANNTGNLPYKNVAGTGAYWLELGSTNKYKCLDIKVASQTLIQGSASYTFQTNTMIDSVYLGNVDADTATITAVDPNTSAIVYGPTTYNLTRRVSTFFDWFFSPIENIPEFTDIDLPPYYGLKITVTLTNTAATVKVGTMLVGLSKTLGTTLTGVSFTIRDYSVKTADEFGNYTFTERAFSKMGTFQVLVMNADVDSVNQALAKYRATPIVYVGTTGYSSAIFFGKFNSFSTAVSYPDYSVCNMEIESIT